MDDKRDDWGKDLDESFKIGLAILFMLIAMVFVFTMLLIYLLLTIYLA